jgi:hypothetical protein
VPSPDSVAVSNLRSLADVNGEDTQICVVTAGFPVLGKSLIAQKVLRAIRRNRRRVPLTG